MSNIFRKKGRSGTGSSEKRTTSRRDIVFECSDERADATPTMAEEFLDASPTVRKSVSGDPVDSSDEFSDHFLGAKCVCVCVCALVIVAILIYLFLSVRVSDRHCATRIESLTLSCLDSPNRQNVDTREYR